MAEAVGARIAVTGAGGFVGGALVSALACRAGVKVFPLSRPAFELRNPHTFDLIPRDIDVVVHAAGVLGDVPDTHMMWQVNLVATQALVEHLSAYPRPPYLLFLSTGGVNGATDGVTADACDPRPDGLYALTKYLAEEVVRRTYKGQWGIARLYFPYGPGQALERLIPRLAARIVAGEPITLNREGRPAISPIYIDDLVGILVRLVDTRETGICMVAGNEAVTIGKLAAELAILLNKTPHLVETQTWALDYCAAALPGVAYTPIRDGLRATLHHPRV